MLFPAPARAFSDLGKRCLRQHHYLHIFPVKVPCTTPASCWRSRVSVLTPAGRLAARVPITLHGAQTLKAQAHSHSYCEGGMGTSLHLKGDTRPRTATSHLLPFLMVTWQLLLPPWGRHSPRGGKLPELLLQNRNLRRSQLASSLYVT